MQSPNKRTGEAVMNEYEISFKNDGFVESVKVEAETREEAQEAAIDFWESQGIAHGDLNIRVVACNLPLIPF